MCQSSRSSTVVTPRPVYFRSSGRPATSPACRTGRRFPPRSASAAARASSRRSTRRRSARRALAWCRCRATCPSRVASTCGDVHALLGGGERRAVFAVALAGPLHRHVHGLALRAVTCATTRASLSSTNRGSTTSAISVTGSPGSTRSVVVCDVDGVGHAVHQPAQQLTPEVLVRLVLERHLRVHLPEPRVLHRERERLAAAVALRREHDLVAAPLVGAGQQHRRARLHVADRLTLVRTGMSFQRAVDAASVAAICVTPCASPARVGCTCSARPAARRALRAGRSRMTGSASATGVPGVAAFGERARAAEHQQPAAAPLDELADHPQLIAGERASLDAAEDEAAIGEQLLARLRETGGELLRSSSTSEPQVLVVGRPLQRDDSRFLSSSTARLMNFISGRGSPS